MKFFRAALLILFTVGLAFGQKARPVFHIKRATSPIRTDGVVDEAAWGEAEIVDELWQQSPSDMSRAKSHTQFRAAYDDDFLYFSAIAYDIPDRPKLHA